MENNLNQQIRDESEKIRSQQEALMELKKKKYFEDLADDSFWRVHPYGIDLSLEEQEAALKILENRAASRGLLNFEDWTMEFYKRREEDGGNDSGDSDEVELVSHPEMLEYYQEYAKGKTEFLHE